MTSEPNTDQLILGEIRACRRELMDVSLSLRVDGPWQRTKDHIAYGVQTVKTIPFYARLFLVIGVSLVGIGVCYHSGKVISAGLDILFVSLLFFGGEA